MARDWNEPDTLAALEERIARIAPVNTAPFPISMTKQTDDLGRWVWVVDVHIRVRGITEFEVTGVGETTGEALRRAYLGLNNEPQVLLKAARGNATFGVTP